MKKFARIAATLSFALVASSANAAIVQYANRGAFTTATGAASIETFTSSFHFPLPGGTLNFATTCPACNGGPIAPGSILGGVTYSTEVFSNNGFYFNIDAGGGFVGGFLDSLVESDPRRTLTVAFDALQNGFGFDTNVLMGNFRVDVFGDSNAALGSFNYASANGLTFFGFGSTAANIRSARIASTSGGFNFALDNFTFDGTLIPGPAGVPEPAVWALMIAGFGLVGAAARRRHRVSVTYA
jgi:PEP-CTERM motif